MLERMERARDFRRAAWEGLGKGGWLPSILGYLFNGFTIGMAFVAIVIAELVLANNFGIFEFLNIDMELVRSGHVVEALNGMALGKIEDVQTLSNLCMFVAFASLMVLPFLYMISIFKYGLSAMAMAPKATWDRPSPMKENRFSTSVTPSSEEHKAISTPTISA